MSKRVTQKDETELEHGLTIAAVVVGVTAITSGIIYAIAWLLGWRIVLHIEPLRNLLAEEFGV